MPNIIGLFQEAYDWYYNWFQETIRNMFENMPSNLKDIPYTYDARHEHSVGSDGGYGSGANGVDAYGTPCVWDAHREDVYQGRGYR